MSSMEFNDLLGYEAFEEHCRGARGQSWADPAFCRPAKAGQSMAFAPYPLFSAPPGRDDALRHSVLSHGIHRRLVRSPAFYRQLLEIARYYGGMTSEPLPFAPLVAMKASCRAENIPLTPRARQIYHDFKTSLVARIKENP